MRAVRRQKRRILRTQKTFIKSFEIADSLYVTMKQVHTERKGSWMRIRHVKGAEVVVAADPLVIQSPAEWKGRWKQAVFESAAPLYLEIGMGMGTFIRTHARLHPDISYLGFEINTTVLYKALKRYRAELGQEDSKSNAVVESLAEQAAAAGQQFAAEGTCGAAQNTALMQGNAQGNLRFIRSDARFLTDYFGKAEVDRIYLNFSDPWPKDKNANKRLTSPQFLQRYGEILKPEGVIEFKTDNRGLFDYSVETIPAAGWRIQAISYDLHRDEAMNAGNVMTEYEKKFSEKGNPIYKLIAGRG